MRQLLEELKNANVISELNYQFAKFIDHKQQPYGYSEQQQNLAVLLAALVSFNVMQGHSCVVLDSAATSHFFGLNGKPNGRDFQQEILQKIGKISPLAWRSVLENHIAFSADPKYIAPMLFQHGRLYFYRYWQAERNIATYLQQAVENPSISATHSADTAQNRDILSRFFPRENGIDWQEVAVATALNKRFCLISGGPGTGKTRTVAMLLAALQLKQLAQNQPLLNIALAAPTGKAAARLKESINQNLRDLDLPQSLKGDVPTQASTIHSLIGIRPQQDLPKHHRKNPLHLDLLVVDEASMIDLFVLEKLLNALKPTTRLILLGDKDQLASVEAGNVMGELGQLITFGYSPAHSAYLAQTTAYNLPPQSQNPPSICDSLCYLRHSYRFGEHSGIGRLAAEVNAQQAVKSWQIFANSDFSDLSLSRYPAASEFADKSRHSQQCVAQVVQQAVALYRDYLHLVQKRVAAPSEVSVAEIFAAFQKVRLLSALRVGDLGVENLNQRIAEALQQAGLVHFRHSRDSYFGKPILVTENAPQLHIFSGDIGMMLPDEQGNLRTYFDNGISLSPTRLPAYEAAYMMTVHKSQGSEFDHTLLVLPLTPSPVLTKELLYTAVTRAKKHFTLFGDEKIWKQGVKTQIQRQSGLREMLVG